MHSIRKEKIKGSLDLLHWGNFSKTRMYGELKTRVGMSTTVRGWPVRKVMMWRRGSPSQEYAFIVNLDKNSILPYLQGDMHTIVEDAIGGIGDDPVSFEYVDFIDMLYPEVCDKLSSSFARIREDMLLWEAEELRYTF